jgi:hypothetical protein
MQKTRLTLANPLEANTVGRRDLLHRVTNSESLPADLGPFLGHRFG